MIPDIFLNQINFILKDGSPEFRASIPRFSYFPFGGGSRSCIGEPLAWMEGIIVLATIIKKWKITLEENMKHIET